ncbi:hypothetical protein HYW21_06770 [Candidatus Woesearchaeota archaeon]|nr:hypothetical protein [Candidatus Woesearchaeota archaeon]
MKLSTLVLCITLLMIMVLSLFIGTHTAPLLPVMVTGFTVAEHPNSVLYVPTLLPYFLFFSSLIFLLTAILSGKPKQGNKMTYSQNKSS